MNATKWQRCEHQTKYHSWENDAYSQCQYEGICHVIKTREGVKVLCPKHAKEASS